MKEYSEFGLEGILDTVKGYQKACDMFFELAPNKETKEKLESILYKGGYKDYGISSKLGGRNDYAIEARRRLAMAYLLVRNPNTFEYYSKHKINIFHGTNANALPKILKYGLMSIDDSEKEGISVTTGEKWSRRNGGRSFISVTDDLEIAEGYSVIEPDQKDSKLSFSVVIGTSEEDVRKSGVCRIHSDLPEIGLKKKIPPENIKTLGVPSEKVEIVKKMVGDSSIEVLPIDGIDEKFHYIDEFGILSLSEDRYNNMKHHLAAKKPKIFGINEVRGLAEKMKLTSVRSKISEIYTTLKGGMKEDAGRKV